MAPLVFVMAACVQLFYLLTLPVSLSIDSYSYIGFASNLLNSQPYLVRTPGYPALVALTALPWSGTALPLIALQVVMAASIPVLFYLAVRDAGRTAGLIAAGLAIVFPYPYTMSLQVMSEIAYLFGCVASMALLATCLKRQSMPLLLLTVAAIAITAEARPSANLLYAALLFALGVRYVMSRNRRTLTHFAVATALALGIVVGRGAMTERNSSNIAPFIVWHWMSTCQLPDGQSCVSVDNGPATRALFDTVRGMLVARRDVYESLASSRDIRGGTTGIRPAFRDFSPQSVDRLVMDLQTNTRENSHRGGMTVLALWSHLGMSQTGSLMRPVLLETIRAHPVVLGGIAERFVRALFIEKNVVSMDEGLYVLHDGVYWYFVPHDLDERNLLETFPGGANLYAQWISALERRTGTDMAAKQLYGRVPESWPEALAAWREHGNRSAVALYAGSRIARAVVILACLGSILLLPFALRSPQWLFALTSWLTFWGLIATSFFSQHHYRQILLHAHGLFFVVAIGGGELLRALARLRHRDSAETEPLHP